MSKRRNAGAEISEEFVLEIYKLFRSISKTSNYCGMSSKKVRDIVTLGGKLPLLTKYTSLHDKLSQGELGYFCGLLATDGCLHKNQTVLQIGLQEKDRNVVENFARKISDPPLRVRTVLCAGRINKYKDLTIETRQNLVFTSASLPSFYHYLIDLGITPAKSKTLDVNLEGKSEEFLWHFFRGVIDGDGSVYPGRIIICSASPAFLRTLSQIYGGEIKVKNSKVGNPLQFLYFNSSASKAIIKSIPIEPYMVERKNVNLRLHLARIENSSTFVRNSVLVNKKHFELNDKEWLKEQRKLKSCAQIAKDIGAHHFSVAYACKGFTDEEQAEFYNERKRQKR